MDNRRAGGTSSGCIFSGAYVRHHRGAGFVFGDFGGLGVQVLGLAGVLGIVIFGSISPHTPPFGEGLQVAWKRHWMAARHVESGFELVARLLSSNPGTDVKVQLV